MHWYKVLCYFSTLCLFCSSLQTLCVNRVYKCFASRFSIHFEQICGPLKVGHYHDGRFFLMNWNSHISPSSRATIQSPHILLPPFMRQDRTSWLWFATMISALSLCLLSFLYPKKNHFIGGRYLFGCFPKIWISLELSLCYLIPYFSNNSQCRKAFCSVTAVRVKSISHSSWRHNQNPLVTSYISL